jgi:hypothetical protein
MIGTILGAAAGLASSIFGGISARKQKKRQQAELNRQDAENTSWYNANALGDYTQRADAQALLRNLRETLAKRTTAMNNSAVITGATNDALNSEKEQANKTIADVYSQLGAQGQAYKDSITDRYLNTKRSISNARLGIDMAQQQAGNNLAQSGLNVMSNAFNTYAQYKLLGDKKS